MEKIKGLIDAPFTPFHEDGSLNLAPIPEYAALLARNGLKGVFINGSSGEGYMLTEEERMQLAEAWMAAVPEDFKVIVHVGSTSVMSSRRLAEHAQKIGAWGIGAMATLSLLRGDCFSRSRTSFLLLSHPCLQRSFPIYV